MEPLKGTAQTSAVWLMAGQKKVIGVTYYYQGAGTHILMPGSFLYQAFLILSALLSLYLWPVPFLLVYI